jgi:phosphatidylserine/phosphatidylglycerophosphate/cardiolipin synthase-like enzyme
MNAQELDALLVKSLADHKLSGSERQELLAFTLNQIDSEQERHVARSRVFVVARDAARDDHDRQVLTWVEDALKALAPAAQAPVAEPSAAFFSPGEACLAQIVHRFSTARRTADVCVFTITDDRITRALLDAHRRGVRMRVITDNEKAFDLGSDIGQIRDAKVPLRVDQTPYHMHHKYAIFDGTRLLNGSYNWTRGAARDNEENITDTGDPRLTAAFQQHFEALWTKLPG